MIFSLLGGKGKKIANQVADHLGIERNLFDTAMMEMGISWSHWKPLANDVGSIPAVAEGIVPELRRGLDKLEAKWGPQPQIDTARNTLLSQQSSASTLDVEPDIAPDFALDVKASEAVKSLFASNGVITNSFDIMRNQILHRFLKEMFEDEKAAIMLLSLWANVADRPMSPKSAADLTGFSEEVATHSMDTLFQSGILQSGEGQDGITYYRLSQRGMNVGRHCARKYLEIAEVLPLQ